VNLVIATEIDAVPVAEAVGVNVAVYVVPEPANDDNVPPATVTSANSKFVDDSDNVNVMVSVCPADTVVVPALVMVTVGTVASIVTAKVLEYCSNVALST
jgi:hypothetical protein